MVIKKILSLPKEEYYSKHLAIINPLLPKQLTPKEIEVLALFMSFDGTIASDRFGTTARKIVMERLHLSLAGLSNHIKSLKTKGFINEGKIPNVIFPERESQEYTFKLINLD